MRWGAAARIPWFMAEAAQSTPKANAAFGFIIEAGEQAHAYGVSSHRLQVFLQRLARALGLDGEFSVTPSVIQFIVRLPGEHAQRFHVSRMPSASFDMGRLSKLSGLVDAVEAGDVSLEAAKTRLQEIRQGGASSLRDVVPGALAYAACGAGFAVLMSARWEDVAVSALGSLIVFLLIALNDRWPVAGPRLEIAAGVSVAIVASVAARLLPGGDPAIMAMCSLVVLLPGYSPTLGAAELSAGLVVSGLERFMVGLTSLLKLFLGAVGGVLLVQGLAQQGLAPPEAGAPGAWGWASAVLLVLGLAVIFKAEVRDYPWIAISGLLAYAGIILGAPIGYWEGSFGGAMLAGLYASLFARQSRRPSSIVLIPAVMVLVPGGSALLGLEAGAQDGGLAALQAEWRTLANAGATIAGLLAAGALLPPKQAL